MTKTVTFEKIVGGGKALGYLDGKPCFAAGPLPGEMAEVEVTRDKAQFVEAAVVRIVEASQHRKAEAEAHYLLCSPWQNVDYEYQLELKRGVLEDAFRRPGLDVAVDDMIGASKLTGYRNKLEFSIAAEDGAALAFHRRGRYEELVKLPQGCGLGNSAMNAAAQALLDRAVELGAAEVIETITVRQSRSTGNVAAHVALRKAPKRRWEALMGPELQGLTVSVLKGRNSYETLVQLGQAELADQIGGVNLSYPYDGFFQTNLDVFDMILERIMAAVPAGARIIDLYGGAGAIGLAAAANAREVVGVEINASSVRLANDNAAANGIKNYEAIVVPAQKMDPAVLVDADCVIVDPPRAGLEQTVVRQLLEAAPARIIYLSCNPVTQARDAALLSEGYDCRAVTGFDMYPGTLHLESLMIFDTKKRP